MTHKEIMKRVIVSDIMSWAYYTYEAFAGKPILNSLFQESYKCEELVATVIGTVFHGRAAVAKGEVPDEDLYDWWIDYTQEVYGSRYLRAVSRAIKILSECSADTSVHICPPEYLKLIKISEKELELLQVDWIQTVRKVYEIGSSLELLEEWLTESPERLMLELTIKESAGTPFRYLAPEDDFRVDPELVHLSDREKKEYFSWFVSQIIDQKN